MASPAAPRAELAELAAAYRDAAHTLTVCRQRLNARIVAAIDQEHMPPREVAHVVGVSKPRIYAILAGMPN